MGAMTDVYALQQAYLFFNGFFRKNALGCVKTLGALEYVGQNVGKEGR